MYFAARGLRNAPPGALLVSKNFHLHDPRLPREPCWWAERASSADHPPF